GAARLSNGPHTGFVVEKEERESVVGCSVVERAATQQPTDHVQRIATITEKAALLGPLPRLAGQHTGKLALPDVTQLLAPIEAAVAQSLLYLPARQTALGQFFTNSQGTIAGVGAHPNVAFEIPRLTEQAFLGEPIERRLDQLKRSTALAKFAYQLNAPMFAAGQQIHCGPPYGGGVIQHDGHGLRGRRQPDLFLLQNWPWYPEQSPAACRESAARSHDRSRDSLPGTWPHWPCLDRSCCPCRRTRHRTSLPAPAARPDQ